MTDEITPALTAEEWADALDNEFTRQRMLAESCDPVLGNDHRRAALSLHGQPFGFTREEVEAVNEAASFLGEREHESAEILDPVWQKIRALLPPDDDPLDAYGEDDASQPGHPAG